MENKNIYVVVETVYNDGENYVSSHKDKNSAIQSIIDGMLRYDEIDDSEVSEVQDMLNENMYYATDDNKVLYEIFETTIN